MSAREFPEWTYSYPDEKNRIIKELERQLLEMNDLAARRSEIPPCRRCELREPCPDHGEPA